MQRHHHGCYSRCYVGATSQASPALVLPVQVVLLQPHSFHPGDRQHRVLELVREVQRHRRRADLIHKKGALTVRDDVSESPAVRLWRALKTHLRRHDCRAEWTSGREQQCRGSGCRTPAAIVARGRATSMYSRIEAVIPCPRSTTCNKTKKASPALLDRATPFGPSCRGAGTNLQLPLARPIAAGPARRKGL